MQNNYFRTAILFNAGKKAFDLIILSTILKFVSTIFVFHQKKTFTKSWKMLLISSKKLSFLLALPFEI